MEKSKRTIAELLSEITKLRKSLYLEGKNITIKKRRRCIPATVRNTIWNKYIGDKEKAKCYCCKIEPITKGNYDCGHIISDKDGGEINIENMRPICGLCNKSMGAMNMTKFMKQYGYNK